MSKHNWEWIRELGAGYDTMYRCTKCDKRHCESADNPDSRLYKVPDDCPVKNPEATWSINLYTECPKCGEDVDLLDYDDFWVDRQNLQVCEHKDDVDVDCPNCGYGFLVNTIY